MEVLGSGPGEVPQMGFLGMTLCHVPKKGIFVHQMEYVRGLLAKHQMENSNPSKVLLPQEECLDPLEERTLAEARAEDPNWQPNARALKEAQKGAGELVASNQNQGGHGLHDAQVVQCGVVKPGPC